MSIVMDSRTPQEPKPDADRNVALQLLKLVAPKEVGLDFENRLRAGGLGYGDLKKALFEHYWNYFAVAARAARARGQRDYVEQVLRDGARTRPRRSPAKCWPAPARLRAGSLTDCVRMLPNQNGKAIWNGSAGGGSDRRHFFTGVQARASRHGISTPVRCAPVPSGVVPRSFLAQTSRTAYSPLRIPKAEKSVVRSAPVVPGVEHADGPVRAREFPHPDLAAGLGQEAPALLAERILIDRDDLFVSQDVVLLPSTCAGRRCRR